jgi:hypothetical protein
MEWIRLFRSFLDLTFVDYNHVFYPNWLNVLGSLSFYCHSRSKGGLKFVEDGMLVIDGMKELNNKIVYDKLDPSLDAFAFCVFRKKLKILEPYVSWSVGRPDTDSVGEVIMTTFKKDNNDGFEWGWTNDDVIFYHFVLSSNIEAFNRASELPLDGEKDVFRFPGSSLGEREASR